MRRYTLLPLLALLLGACTATPITLPLDDWRIGPYNDGGVALNDAMNTDVMPLPPGDTGWTPDMSTTGDAGMDASSDAISDGTCLECPLSDGMPDGSTDGGPGEAGAQPDLVVDGAAGQ